METQIHTILDSLEKISLKIDSISERRRNISEEIDNKIRTIEKKFNKLYTNSLIIGSVTSFIVALLSIILLMR
jgi:hypothetical protein